MTEELQPDCNTPAVERPSLLEKHLRKEGQAYDANVLAKDRLAKSKRLADGRFAPGNVPAHSNKGKKINGRASLRDRLYALVEQHEAETGQDAFTKVMETNPAEVLRVLASLEPKNLKVEQEIRQIVIVCHAQAPPPGWSPPDLTQLNDPEVQQAINAHVIDEAVGDD